MNHSNEFQNHNYIEIDNFIKDLYQLFIKGKKNWNEDNLVLCRVVSSFIRLLVNSILRNYAARIKNSEALHYAVVVPSEWGYEIRDELLRPIFIQSGHISKNDHQDRLIFLSDLDSIFYYFQLDITQTSQQSGYFKVGEHRIMGRINPLKDQTVSIRLDLIETQRSLNNFPDALLHPKATYSRFFVIADNDVKKNLKTFLKPKLYPEEADTGKDAIICMIVDYIYKSIRSRMVNMKRNKTNFFNSSL